MKVSAVLGLQVAILAMACPALSADVSEWCPEGFSAYVSGDMDAANLAISSCLYNPPDEPKLASEGYYMRGETYYERGDYVAAVSDFDLAVELWPDNAAAWRSKAMVHYEQEDFLEAITAITRSLDIDSQSTESHFVHAIILTAMDRPNLAMDAYDLGFSFETRENVQRLQRALEDEGFRVGDIDGVYGARTRDALKACIAAGCVLEM